MKNKKSLIALILAALIVTIAGTLAYFTDTVSIDNEFAVSDFNVELIEEFISPANWKPGDETNKVVTAKNNGAIPAKVRIKLVESWKDENGDELPLVQDGNRIAQINFVNTSNWAKSGEYYYYNATLNANDVTSAIINKVTFNPLFISSKRCKTDVNRVTTCTSYGEEYEGGTYSLKVIAEFAQADYYLNAWNVTDTEIASPTKYKVTFDTNGGRMSNYEMLVQNGNKYNTLPTPTKEGYTFIGWYFEKTFTNKVDENVTINQNSDIILFAKWEVTPAICQRAETLHTQNGKTFGNLGSGNTLTSGDAFDCDLTGSGDYSERFYYVSDYFDTNTQSFDSNTAVLIYSNNVSNGVTNNSALYLYDTSGYNYSGPISLKGQLPTTSQWSNVSLKKVKRQILTENLSSYDGKVTDGSNPLPSEFDYTGYAARLLTIQEVNSACRITAGSFSIGELDQCTYLLENTKYETSSIGNYGYWLENPVSNLSSSAFSISGSDRYVGSLYTNNTSYYGVRPVIEVPKIRIDK